LPRPAPDRASYCSYAALSHPDGNTWLLQEVTTRRDFVASANDLASALRRAEAAHGEHGERTGQRDENGTSGTPRTWWRSGPAKSCRNETSMT